MKTEQTQSKPTKPNCYECKHRRDLSGNAHSVCTNPLALVTGDAHGIANGWFFHPYNFDPIWLASCEGFEDKNAKPDPWAHKDEWKRCGKNSQVVVSRHSATSEFGLGPHRWCVYAYVYPKHPHFANFSGNNMWQDAASVMPLHAGPSYLRWHRDDEGKATSVQVGCDYNHLHDHHYCDYATKDDARSVFVDADELFDWLESIAANKEETEQA